MEPPLDPPPFDPPVVIRCIREFQRVQNHDEPKDILILTSMTQSLDEALNPVVPEEQVMERPWSDDEESYDHSYASSSSSTEDFDENSFIEAFMICRTIRKNNHGGHPTYVHFARKLRSVRSEDVGWRETGEVVAIKSVSFECIRNTRHRIAENFYEEAAAMNYISNFLRGRPIEETHILTADVVMCDNSDLFIVMPYCHDGDLCTRVAHAEQTRLTEDEAKVIFKQILMGLDTLQRLKICHKDLSPENVMILENRSLIIDFGMCLRIPYTDDSRHLLTPRTPCGKLPHVSPEIYFSHPFDGHAIEIWAAGTILLFMLTGLRFKITPCQDLPMILVWGSRLCFFLSPQRDGALDRVDNNNLGISTEAMDLLRKILRFDPNDRLTLEQIRAHAWMTS